MPWTRRNNGVPANRLPPRKRQTALNRDGVKRDVIVIGASAGGVMALAQLFEQLPGDLPAVIGVVLHRAAIPSELAYVLGRRSALPLIEPSGCQALKKGHIYLAPSDHHLLFSPDSVTIQRGPKEHSTRPAVDPLFRSAAEAFGRRVVGALLTGCGEDGVGGLIAISGQSGITLTQDPEEAYMPYMPLNALRYDDIGGVFSLDEMASALCNLAKGNAVLQKKVRSKYFP